MLFQLILMSLIGTLCIVLGLLIWKGQRITLIHDYQWSRVREEDKPAYTCGIGRATALLGLGVLLTGIMNYLTGSQWGWLIFFSSFAISMVQYIRVQGRYNKYRK